MKRTFISPELTNFGRLEDITTEYGTHGHYGSGNPEDREREERVEEGGDDDFESIGIIGPDLEEGREH